MAYAIIFSVDTVKEQSSVETATYAVAESAWQHRANHARNKSALCATIMEVLLLPQLARYVRNRTAGFVFQFVQKKNVEGEFVETAEAKGAAATPAASIFVLIINFIVLLEGARLHSATTVLRDHLTMKRKMSLAISANIARIYANRERFFVLHVPTIASLGSVPSAKMSFAVLVRNVQ